jgi:hypothetical protein
MKTYKVSGFSFENESGRSLEMKNGNYKGFGPRRK